jgi:hypothetical protein
MTEQKITVRPRPCATCPYRRDVPSGVWAESEYAKLPAYDGTTGEQAEAGAFAPFHCHSTPETLCAGWVGTHDMDESLAMRMQGGRMDPAVWQYESPVPLFASGAEAAAHGMRDLEHPGPEAGDRQRKLLRLIAAREADDER